MARICFLSLNLESHCDFGGHGFVKTAAALAARGHEVEWTLSKAFPAKQEERTRTILQKHGIALADPEPFHLAGFTLDPQLVAASVHAYAAFLKRGRFDVAIIDKMSTFGNHAAHAAGIPWANVGTDGLKWGYRRGEHGRALGHATHELPGFQRVVAALGISDLPEVSAQTYWGASPFLNISYFPRSFYGDVPDRLPECSHFVGGPREPGEARCERSPNRLLVTLGNTFAPSVRRPFLAELTGYVRARRDLEVLLLGESIPSELEQLSNVEVRSYAPYAEVFGQATAVIGHGGMNFSWFALHHQVRPLLVPSGVGDQVYNALQMLRHGACVAFPRRAFWARLPFLRRRGVSLPRGAVATGLDELLSVRASPAFDALATTAERGGGVAAAAALIERLAATRRPVLGCQACCC